MFIQVLMTSSHYIQCSFFLLLLQIKNNYIIKKTIWNIWNHLIDFYFDPDLI